MSSTPRRSPRVNLTLVLLLLATAIVAPVEGQITSEGTINVGSNATPETFNSLGDADATVSGVMTAANDLYISDDLEVGDEIHISAGSFLAGRLEGFITPNRLVLETADNPTDDPELRLRSRNVVRLYADFDNDTATTEAVTLYNNGGASGNRIALFGPFGTLQIAGTLSENVGFDLAESYLAGETLRPGELVRVAPSSARTVLRGAGSGPDVIGVVSTRPGIVMGGAPFSVGKLREVWGDEVADLFEAQRPELETAVLAEDNGLAARLEMVSNPPRLSPSGPNDDGDSEDSSDFETVVGDLETAVIRRFFELNVVPVALSGRAPVLVDSSYGTIVPGDRLAPSPVPGVAMRAHEAGPVIGIALESFDGGQGPVMAFIQRGWYGGEALERADLTAGPGGGLVVNGALVQASSRSMKRHIAAIDSAEVLDRVSELPVATWSYTSDPTATVHVGPMAEDFHRLFGTGTDAQHIALSDLSGVALAAIQALSHENRRLAERIAVLEAAQAEKSTP